MLVRFDCVTGRFKFDFYKVKASVASNNVVCQLLHPASLHVSVGVKVCYDKSKSAKLRESSGYRFTFLTNTLQNNSC